MKFTLVLLSFLFIQPAFGKHCELITPGSRLQDQCSNPAFPFGYAYKGQKVECFANAGSAIRAMDASRACKGPDKVGSYAIITRNQMTRDLRSCPNFGVTHNGFLTLCHRTLEGAYQSLTSGMSD